MDSGPLGRAGAQSPTRYRPSTGVYYEVRDENGGQLNLPLGSSQIQTGSFSVGSLASGLALSAVFRRSHRFDSGSADLPYPGFTLPRLGLKTIFVYQK